MKYAFAAALLLGISSGVPAFAGSDDLQPAVFARLSFGGKAAVSDLRLGFRADYSDRIRARLAATPADTPAAQSQMQLRPMPALFQAEWSTDRLVFSENGLPIAGRSLRLDETGEEKSGSNWGLNLGLALAATGAALALIINSAGHAAQENQPHTSVGSNGVNTGSNGGGGSGGSGGGTCVGVGPPNEVCTPGG